jgi:hypothetical protein
VSEPFIDEHRLTVEAPPQAVWEAVVRFVRRQRGPVPRLGARLLGAEPARASPGEVEVGSTVPGFAVARLRPGELLVLQGSHRFSTYTLVFRLAPAEAGTTISAVSAAHFPGAWGRLYRALVLGSGLHRVAVRAMLGRIAAGSAGSVGRLSPGRVRGRRG